MEQDEMARGSLHPVVRRHPVTGEPSLYVDHTYAVHIDGMTTAESDALLGFLRAHVTQETLTCRVRWEQGMLVVWDNRLVVHRAFNDYDGFRREHYRTIVKGEEPVMY